MPEVSESEGESESFSHKREMDEEQVEVVREVLQGKVGVCGVLRGQDKALQKGPVKVPPGR